MFRVLSNTYRHHNRKPSFCMSLVYFLVGLACFAYGMGGLSQEVNLTTQQFLMFGAIMTGGCFAAMGQLVMWATGE